MNRVIEVMMFFLGLNSASPGCSAPAWEEWPEKRKLRLMWVLVIAGYFIRLYGIREFTVTSLYRPEPCNTDRGGAPGSKHRFGEEANEYSLVDGDDYAAIDIDIPDSVVAEVRENARDMPDILRELTGWLGGIGFIVYPSGRVHIDIRRYPDWVDVR